MLAGHVDNRLRNLHSSLDTRHWRLQRTGFKHRQVGCDTLAGRQLSLGTQELSERVVLPYRLSVELEYGDALRLSDGEAWADGSRALAHHRVQRDTVQRHARHAALVPLGADV